MTAPLDLDQLRTFVAIADSGGFTRAADVVHKTQSAVSMQMRKLEERIGRPIFLRDGRQSRLTADGERLLQYARRLVALSAEALSAFADPNMAGNVRLGLPDDYAPRLLPAVLAAFSRSHPLIEVEVCCEGSSTVRRLVAEGEIDLGIVTMCDVHDGEMIRREPLYWVGSQQHSAHLADPLPLAVGPLTCAWRQAATRRLEAAGRRYRIAYVSASGAALTGAVLAGLAVATLPENALTAEMRILRERDGFAPLPSCDIALIRARHAVGPLYEALAQHIVASLDNITPRAAYAEAAE